MFKYILYYLKNFLILIRINKPTGIMLLMFPAIWSILIVLKEEIDIYLLLLFAYGSFIMRSAGCIINDIIDKKFDRNVERTKLRPLASENLESSDAIILFIIFLSIGLSILLSLNSTCILLGFIAFPLIFLYPLMKRFTYFPQLCLAIVFNFSVLISWTAAKGEFDNQSLLLYLACIFWTLGYDTIYAYQDINDDKKIGVKSLAIYLEKNIKAMYDLIRSAPKFDKDYILYRFIKDDPHLINLSVGDTINTKSFLSTTRDPFYRSEEYKFGFIILKIKMLL